MPKSRLDNAKKVTKGEGRQRLEEGSRRYRGGTEEGSRKYRGGRNEIGRYGE
jgi:hypothetical protein